MLTGKRFILKFLEKKKELFQWITLLIITNLLSIFLFTSGFIKLPNTVVLKNESSEFLSELVKINGLNRVINSQYVGDVNNSAMGETLVNSMFSYLGDPYSEYYSGQEYAELLDSFKSSFGGIGVIINGTDPNNLVITEVIEDSPAAKAGIQPNDVIIKVNNEDIVGQGIDLVVDKTRGEVGTDVNLTVLREGNELSFDLTRDSIDSKTVSSEIIDNIGIIDISSFGFNTADEFETEVNSLIDQGVSGIIIDLRNNGGGIVQSAVKVADLLMDEDQVGYAVSNKNHREYFTTKNGKINIPFVVLVNEYTASASELLSGALQKSGTIIIGKNTFGKGVIQQMAQLGDGSGYKLTVQEYFLKDDTQVNKVGIQPDIVVDNVLDEETQTYSDNQLQSALEYLQNK